MATESEEVVTGDVNSWHPQGHLTTRQVSPPPPVAVELEVATTDMWCHT